jgi:hypothetical protein
MKKKDQGQFTKTWAMARQLLEDKNFEKAEETLDMGILLLIKAHESGYRDKDLIEGVKKETWHERFWVAIQNHIWPRRPDYIKNWKCD